MIMTNEQKYSAVLEGLGELLQSKNTTISCQQWQIDQLKEKLEAAEKERDNTADRRIAVEAVAAQLRAANDVLHQCVNVQEETIVDADRLLDMQDYIQRALQALEAGGAA